MTRQSLMLQTQEKRETFLLRHLALPNNPLRRTLQSLHSCKSKRLFKVSFCHFKTCPLWIPALAQHSVHFLSEFYEMTFLCVRKFYGMKNK